MNRKTNCNISLSLAKESTDIVMSESGKLVKRKFVKVIGNCNKGNILSSGSIFLGFLEGAGSNSKNSRVF